MIDFVDRLAFHFRQVVPVEKRLDVAIMGAKGGPVRQNPSW